MNIDIQDPNMAYIQNEFRGRTFGKDFVVEHGFLYDKWTVAAAGSMNETTTQWFVNVGAGTNKTLADTNISTSRKLDAPQAFSVKAVRLMWHSNVGRADLDLVLNNFAFELQVADAWKFRAPVACFPAGGGLNFFTTAAATTVSTNGLPTSEAVRVLAVPIVIESGVSFFARLVGSTQVMTAAFTCYCILEGLHARPTVG